MTLMSFTAWAATDISSFAIRTQPVQYGTAIAVTNIAVRDVEFQADLNQGTDFTLVGVYSDEACTTPVTGTKLPVNTYYVKVEGAGTYTGTKTASIQVVKKEIKVTLNWSEGNVPLFKTYGEADPTFTVDYTGAAFETGDNSSVFTGTPALAEHSNDVAYTTGTSPSVTGVAIELTGITADNYVAKLNDAATGTSGTLDFTKMTINPKQITPAMFGTAADATVCKKTYIGAAVTPSYTITDGTKTLEVGKDYTVTVADGTAITGVLPAGTLTTVGSDNVAINVGNYAVTVEGSKNYVTTSGLTCSLQIAQAPMTVAVKNIEVAYQAAKYSAISATPEFSYYGFVGQDVAYGAKLFDGVTASDNPEDGGYTAPTVGLVSTENLTDVGSYSLTLSGGAATNYKFNLVTTGTEAGKFVIKPFALSATADSKSKTVGETDPALTFVTAAANGSPTIPRKVTNQDAIDAAAAASTTAPDPVYEPLWTTEPTLTRGEGESKGDYPISFATNGTPAANYSIAADKYFASVVEGGKIKSGPKFTINPATATITVLNHEKVYGAADPAEFNAPVAGTDYIVSGMKAGETLANVKIVRVEEAAADAEKVGNHGITVTYDNPGTDYSGVTVIPGILEIKQAPITIEINDQTVQPGQAIDQTLVTVTGLKEGDAKSKVVTLILDEFSIVFASDPTYTAASSLTAGNIYFKSSGGSTPTYTPFIAKAGDATTSVYEVSGVTTPASVSYLGVPVYSDGTPAVAVETPYVNGIKFIPYEGADSKAANYKFPTITATTTAAELLAMYGNLAVVDPAGTIVLNRAEKKDYSDAEKNNAATVIAAAATATATTGTKNVTFGDFTMLPEKWYPIVLPFETNVEEISRAFGYAVVNVLNKENTDATKVSFKLHMGKIAANTPFVVKVYNVWDEANSNKVNMNAVKFYGKKIVAPADYEAVTSADAKDKSGITFLGTYKGKTDGFRANEWYFSTSADYNQFYPGNATNTTYLRPLGAWLRAETSGARVFEFEEADGTVTAIQAIAVEGPAANAEGWYTIGGVKLQGAPTRKGIYINNGKKVVVK